MNQPLGQRPIHEQLQAFTDTVAANPFVTAVLDRGAALNLPGWYLVSGCLFQTVWNIQHGFDPTRGIRDYDLFYFDASDTSWEAEDRVVRECAGVFKDLPIKVEVRNQARVHLWYAEKFGAPCDVFRSSEDGIDAFLATTCCVGMRGVSAGPVVYAPHGFADVFNMVVRPNAARALNSDALREVHEAKARRWQQVWPRLTLLPWPGPQAQRQS
jgi:hypothetical protein